MAIRPDILLQQVMSTAAWAFADETAPYIHALSYQPADNDDWQDSPDYFRMLFAAHFTTVATYVPTDVDSRIRFHAWQGAGNDDQLEALVRVIDEAASWPVRAVSASIVDYEGDYVCGHDGEFFSVWAGALGRAVQLGHRPLTERLSQRIADELTRQSRFFLRLARTEGAELLALGAACTLAHSGGDLTRVVDEWPAKSDEAKRLCARFSKPERSQEAWGAGFALAGKINRDVMAKENHRFLPLREARPLRRSRDFLFAFGPLLDGLGERVAQSEWLDEREKAEVLAAFLAGIDQAPDQDGYVRAVAGMHRRLRGGVDSLSASLPARLRKTLRQGAWRRELDVDETRFNARLVARWRRSLSQNTISQR